MSTTAVTADNHMTNEQSTSYHPLGSMDWSDMDMMSPAWMLDSDLKSDFGDVLNFPNSLDASGLPFSAGHPSIQSGVNDVTNGTMEVTNGLMSWVDRHRHIQMVV